MKNKRNCGSKILFDMDDFIILQLLSNHKFLLIEYLKDSLNISHKGLLTHLKRLTLNKFIFTERTMYNYKIKMIRITSLGRIILSGFSENRIEVVE